MANQIQGLRPDGTLPTRAVEHVEQIVSATAGAGVPIFETLAEAEAWEVANPGRVALTLEPSTPDTTPPVWNASLTVEAVSGSSAVLRASALATDDRRVSYEVSTGGQAWSPIVPNGLLFTVTGLVMATSYTLRLRAVDGAGNVSAVLSAQVTTLMTAPDDFAYRWVADDFSVGAWADTVAGATLSGTAEATLVGDEVQFGVPGLGGAGYSVAGLSSGETARTLMVVARLTSTPTSSLHGFIGQSGPHAVAIPGGGGRSAGWYSMLAEGSTASAVVPAGNVADNNRHVITVRIDGASSTLTHDRTTVAAESGPGATLDTLSVGAGLHGASHSHAVSEIRIYPRRLTDQELTALHAEMGATYGFTV